MTARKAIRTLLPARLLNLRRLPISHQPVMRLKLLHHLVRVVDQREAGALATAILCSEAEDGDLIFVGFVELGEFGAEFVFGDVGAIGVEDVTEQSFISKHALIQSIRQEEAELDIGDAHDHLLSSQEGIADELARAQRYGLLAVCHIVELDRKISIKCTLTCVDLLLPICGGLIVLWMVDDAGSRRCSISVWAD